MKIDERENTKFSVLLYTYGTVSSFYAELQTYFHHFPKIG